ncbi:MAG TPA: patatin-like phospholipase family protein [Vicinamibacterales bacterium]|nr:patatin-like phospholipase family protein [Vicinamibacterales bacterium]
MTTPAVAARDVRLRSPGPMNQPLQQPGADAPPAYSPGLRTALVLTGTGTAGAYHAGALRALHEAGVKIDIVAGRGVGAVGALFAAIDGASRLWEPKGLWRGRSADRLYPWRGLFRLAGWTVLAVLAVLCVPLAGLALGLIVYPLDFLLHLVSLDRGGALAAAYVRLVEAAFAGPALPTLVPRLVVFLLGLLLVAVTGAAIGRLWHERRRTRGHVWWKLWGAPLASAPGIGWACSGLWRLMGGAAAGLKQPPPRDLGRRYAELLAENLGQPGFRELLLTAFDLDAGRDLFFALLAEPRRHDFFRQPAGAGAGRLAEALDLAGVGRDHLLDALAGALSLPVATEPHLIHFAPESAWQGETHRLCDRPGALGRLLEEVAAAGARQVILVTAAPELTGPHHLMAGVADPRRRAGEYVARMEAAELRDAIAGAHGLVERLFEIRPRHNPLGPLDFSGCYDEHSDRTLTRDELIDRGYEDAYHQFVEPVVGASGDRLESGAPGLER